MSYTAPGVVRYILVVSIANACRAATASAQATPRHDVFGRNEQFNWDERDGLPQNTVRTIATTRRLRRMGTYEGAARSIVSIL